MHSYGKTVNGPSCGYKTLGQTGSYKKNKKTTIGVPNLNDENLVHAKKDTVREDLPNNRNEYYVPSYGGKGYKQSQSSDGTCSGYTNMNYAYKSCKKK